MKRITKYLFILLLLFSAIKKQQAQSLLDMLEPEETTNYATGVFKSTRMINGYTSEMAGKNELVFMISHRFGKINAGLYDLFGLDQSNIRFGFEYGIHDRIDLGIGRSSFQKLYDGYIKIKLLRQSDGLINMPVSVTLLEGIAFKSQKWTNAALDYPLTARFYYVHELFISRKFTEKISIQVVPVLLHRNFVLLNNDQNTVGAVGLGGMYKITSRFTAIGEYYYLLPGQTADDFDNSLSLGIEIETGGHVFQLNFSNATGMTEKIFIPETSGTWTNGNIHFGFNVIRVF